jgi:RNA polymerase sigma-70 factor (ECF subfamily)
VAAARTEKLYRDHGRLVGGLCRALLRDPAEGEDAAQRVFLAAHKALLNGTSPREPAAWLATIARNECWTSIRARMREPLPSAELDGQTSSSDPVADAIRNADLAAMWSAIAELPRQQRDALLLREFGGLSYEELAGALAVSGSAVESLLFRARQGVRTRLETAYAGLSGGSWLESLARLAGGLGGGMAPVAAKVAAVGVGAAVATGGAVVAPRMLDHPRRSHHAAPLHRAAVTTRQAPTRQASAHQAPTRQSPVQPVPIDVARLRPAPAAGTLSVRRHATERRRDGGRSDDDRSSAAGDHSSSGEGSSAASGRTREGESFEAAKSGSSRGGSPEGDRSESGSSSGGQSSDGQSSDGQSSDGQSSEGHSSRGHSSDGHSSDGQPGSPLPADEGGAAATNSNPALTVTVPTSDDPPHGGGSGPGDDG